MPKFATEPMKLCIDCRWSFQNSRPFVPTVVCSCFNGEPSPVNGEPMLALDAGKMRFGPCGPEAKFFEPKA